MISAGEARVLTNDFLTEKDKDQLKDIDKCIHDSIEYGHMYYFNRLTVKVKRELEKLGYLVVEQDSQKDGYMATIRWWHIFENGAMSHL